MEFYTTVDDEMFDELSELVEQKVVFFELWEDSLADALAEQTVDPTRQSTFDLDLYLEDGVYFEMYGVACFDDPDAEAWRGQEHAGARLATLVAAHAQLGDVAVDDDDGLVLVLATPDGRSTYLVVGAWLLAEWDELPDA